jgi:biotin transport system substrate-specific component
LPAPDLARVAVFAALIAALGLPGTLTPFGNAVPITAQTLGVMLAGALLGPFRGALSCLVFLALVAAGLPVLAGGRAGIDWLIAKPSSGYLLGFPLAALTIGALTAWMLARFQHRYILWLGILINIVGGILVDYAIGIPVQAAKVGSGWLAVVQGATTFLPGDLIKAVLAALVAHQVHRALPGVIGRAGND